MGIKRERGDFSKRFRICICSKTFCRLCAGLIRHSYKYLTRAIDIVARYSTPSNSIPTGNLQAIQRKLVSGRLNRRFRCIMQRDATHAIASTQIISGGRPDNYEGAIFCSKLARRYSLKSNRYGSKIRKFSLDFSSIVVDRKFTPAYKLLQLFFNLISQPHLSHLDQSLKNRISKNYQKQTFLL